MPLPQLTHIPRLDAQLILAHVLEKPRAWVIAHPEATLSPGQESALQDALRRLAEGVPLPYILGHWEFYGMEFDITSDVLIPRPETEVLVQAALTWLNSHPQATSAVDVGTGSGCIAVAVAVHHPGLRWLAVDRSPAALRIARRNAQKHDVVQYFSFVQSDLLTPLPCVHRRAREGERWGVDLLLANLPYIPTATLHGLEVYQHEPTLALDGGSDGLDLIRRLLAQAAGCLAPGGLALLEIEASQGKAALGLAHQLFPSAQSRVLPDMAGLDRLLTIEIS